MTCNVIVFTKEEQHLADNFAHHIALSKGVAPPQEKNIQNNRRGKLGEIAFRRFIEKNNHIPMGSENMFAVWAKKGDDWDFLTTDKSTVDVKTSTQKRLHVPAVKFQKQPMDYYVCILIDQNESEATIKGYATRAEIQKNCAKALPKFTLELKELHPIKELLEQFPVPYQPPAQVPHQEAPPLLSQTTLPTRNPHMATKVDTTQLRTSLRRLILLVWILLVLNTIDLLNTLDLTGTLNAFRQFTYFP